MKSATSNATIKPLSCLRATTAIGLAAAAAAWLFAPCLDRVSIAAALNFTPRRLNS
jgi:hypothetical protein